jgi:hypothetical protein
VLPKMVFSGLRCWVKTDAVETMDATLHCVLRVLLQSRSARRKADDD